MVNLDDVPTIQEVLLACKKQLELKRLLRRIKCRQWKRIKKKGY